MQRDTRPTFDATHNFLTYGPIGLELDRASERRERDWAPAAPLFAITTLTQPRRRLGNWLIGLGEHIAGPRPAPAATR
jgi:hypothetical protein